MSTDGLFTHWVPEYTISIAANSLQDLEEIHFKSYNTFIHTVVLQHDSGSPSTAAELFSIFKVIQELLNASSICFERIRFLRVGKPHFPRFTLLLAADIFKQFPNTMFELAGIDMKDLYNLEDDQQFFSRVISVDLAMVPREALTLQGVPILLSSAPSLQSLTICADSHEGYAHIEDAPPRY